MFLISNRGVSGNYRLFWSRRQPLEAFGRPSLTLWEAKQNVLLQEVILRPDAVSISPMIDTLLKNCSEEVKGFFNKLFYSDFC